MSRTTTEMASSPTVEDKHSTTSQNEGLNLRKQTLESQKVSESPSQQNEHHGQPLGANINGPVDDPTSPWKTRRSMAQIAIVMTSLCACVFLSALEVTIVSTALPTIASHFASDSGYTWIGTSYVLAHTASTPSWGKISDIWGRKPILLIANAIFFAGSLICALVDDFQAFIAGRAVQGLGAAGLQTMVNICISDMFSQRDRGLYYGLTSIVWAVASGIGPVMGGAFTDQVR